VLTPKESDEWPTVTKAGTSLRRGYWCECISPGMHASIDVDTPAQAVRWIRVTLRTIASALEPEASATAWTWITTGHTQMLRTLTHGHADALTLTHNGTLIQWTARPVLFLPLAHREGVPLPECAWTFQAEHTDHAATE